MSITSKTNGSDRWEISGRVDVLKVPAKTPTLQPLPQCQALRDISKIYPWVLSTNGAKQRQREKNKTVKNKLLHVNNEFIRFFCHKAALTNSFLLILFLVFGLGAG
uniref:Uncharacterized protein n=1 Tax=Mola mola TaxID=94237 RepID=A0A3Q3XAP7_MOLML